MHTLPTPVRPKPTRWNPVMNVIAFCGENGTSVLARSNGEVVWTAPGRRQVPAQRSFWSPDGHLLAIVYEDGGHHLINEDTGRLQFSAMSGISCVAWAGAEDDDENEEVDPANAWGAGTETASAAPPETLLDVSQLLANFLTHRRDGPLQIVGTRDGALRINPYGGLPLGEILVGTSSVDHVLVDSRGTEFAAVVDGAFLVLRPEYMARYTPAQLTEIMVKPARLAAIVDEYKSTLARYGHAQRAIRQAHAKFFESSKLDGGVDGRPERAIARAIFFGDGRTGIRDWMDDEHENGLRKWYKAVSSGYDNIWKLLIEYVVPATQYALMLLGDLKAYASSDSELWDTAKIDAANMTLRKLFAGAFELTAAVATEIRLFSAFAEELQAKFSHRLDRTLKFVTSSGVLPSQADACDYAMHHIGGSGPGESTRSAMLELRMTSLLGEFREKFEAATADARAALRSQIIEEYRVPVDAPVLDVRRVGDEYLLLCFQDESLRVEAVSAANKGRTAPRGTLTGTLGVFASDTAIATLEGGTASIYVAELHEKFLESAKIALQGPAVAIAANETHVCALAEDMQSYEIHKWAGTA